MVYLIFVFIFLAFAGSNWQKSVTKYIDPDILPKHWGGNRVDENGNPKCPEIVSNNIYIIGVDKGMGGLQGEGEEKEVLFINRVMVRKGSRKLMHGTM